MRRILLILLIVISSNASIGQVNPIYDTTDVHILDRATLTDEIFRDRIMVGMGNWGKLMQNTVDQRLGIGAFAISKHKKQTYSGMASTIDTSRFSYGISAMGFAADILDHSLRRIAQVGEVTYRVTNNLFEIRVITWDWDYFDRYIYGYLDSKNYLYICTSPYSIDLNDTDLSPMTWRKFYQPGFSVQSGINLQNQR